MLFGTCPDCRTMSNLRTTTPSSRYCWGGGILWPLTWPHPTVLSKFFSVLPSAWIHANHVTISRLRCPLSTPERAERERERGREVYYRYRRNYRSCKKRMFVLARNVLRRCGWWRVNMFTVVNKLLLLFRWRFEKALDAGGQSRGNSCFQSESVRLDCQAVPRLRVARMQAGRLSLGNTFPLKDI